MGIFDFFKSSKEREAEKLLRQMQEKVFPKGKAQLGKEIKDVQKELFFKYTYEQLAYPYINAATSYYLDENRDARTICKQIMADSNGLISEPEAMLVYMYLMMKDDKVEPEPKKKKSSPVELLASRLYMVAKGGIVEIKSFKDLTDGGKFEVILFNSVMILEYFYNRFPDDYPALADCYWKKVQSQGMSYKLTFRGMTLEEFIDNRVAFYSDQLEAFRQSDEDGPMIPSKLYNAFYENPLAETPIHSRNFPQLMRFTVGLNQMTRWVMDGIKRK